MTTDQAESSRVKCMVRLLGGPVWVISFAKKHVFEGALRAPCFGQYASLDATSRVNSQVRRIAGSGRSRAGADHAKLVTHVLKTAISSIRGILRRGGIAR